MSDSIDNLKEALEHSPDNIPLRFLLATNLKTAKRYDEAIEQYAYILKRENNEKAKQPGFRFKCSMNEVCA